MYQFEGTLRVSDDRILSRTRTLVSHSACLGDHARWTWSNFEDSSRVAIQGLHTWCDARQDSRTFDSCAIQVFRDRTASRWLVAWACFVVSQCAGTWDSWRLRHACCSAQPGHWPTWLCLERHQAARKIPNPKSDQRRNQKRAWERNWAPIKQVEHAS